MSSLTWSVAPDNCQRIVPTHLHFQHKGSTSTGTATIELRSNKDNYSSVLGTWQLKTPGKLQTDSLVFPNSFIINDTTTFRWVVLGTTSKTSTYRHDNIILSGNIVPQPSVTQYRDFDNDGYGDTLHPITNCDILPGYVSNWGDCDDSNNKIHPNAFDVSNNSIDENCDGMDFVVSLVENLSELVEIFPNPGTISCMLHWSSRIETRGHLTVTNSMGQTIYYQTITPNIEPINIPVLDWINGVYLFNLSNEQMNKQYLWIKI